MDVTAKTLVTTVIAATALCCGRSDALVVQVGGGADTLSITVVNQNSVVVSSLALQVGDSAQLDATAANSLGLPLGNVDPAWSSSDGTIASVTSSGVVHGVSAGTARITASYAGVTATVPTTVADLNAPPPPPPQSGVPQPSGGIRYDTRSGGPQSIQAASVTTLTQALSATGFSVFDPGSGVIAFVTDADGAGENAFRLDWPGVSATTEIDMSLYRGMGGLGLNNTQEVWIQWKIWQTRTATGGGIGSAGVWDCCSQGPGSGKRIVWFRGSGSNTGRFTFAPGGASGYGEFFIDSSYNPAYADVSVNWNNFVSQWITLTFRFKPDSGPSANDGLFEAWFNSTKIKSVTIGANLTQYDFTGELQLGGPTWIGVPRDQTMYLKDIVVWQP